MAPDRSDALEEPPEHREPHVRYGLLTLRLRQLVQRRLPAAPASIYS
jgi:hypothetical protein